MSITNNIINYAWVKDRHLIKQKDYFMMGGIIILKKNIGPFYKLYFLVDIYWLK